MLAGRSKSVSLSSSPCCSFPVWVGLCCVVVVVAAAMSNLNPSVRPNFRKGKNSGDVVLSRSKSQNNRFHRKDPAGEVARGRMDKRRKKKLDTRFASVGCGRWITPESLRPENDVFLYLVKARRALDGEGAIVRSCYNSFPDRPKKTSLFRLVLFLPSVPAHVCVLASSDQLRPAITVSPNQSDAIQKSPQTDPTTKNITPAFPR